jgi:tetratricopeptide (TPR) repeat protein
MVDTATSARRYVLKTACAVLIATLGILSWRHSAVFADAETLYRDSIARNPQAWIAYQNLGTLLVYQDRRVPEAIDAYRAALAIRPDHFEAKNNLVMAHIKGATIAPNTPEGTAAAIAHLREALRIDPSSAEAHYALGNVLAVSGGPEQEAEAVGHYENALRLNPGHFRAHYNLGTVLMDVPGRQADAIAHLEEALRIQPDSLEAHVNLGIMLADVPARSGEAVRHLELALAKRPDLNPVRELLQRLRADGQAAAH